jgi:hypothetical protein
MTREEKRIARGEQENSRLEGRQAGEEKREERRGRQSERTAA